jgi:hypothetical protein
MKIKQGIIAVLAVLISLTIKANLVVEDFNASRTYSADCCPEYGSYLSFETNMVQNGSGTLVVQATDNGGFYHEKTGYILWNITGQTNLVLTARRLPTNQASNCVVVLRDFSDRYIAYNFPMLSFATNSFTSVAKNILTPDWQGAASFDFSAIISLDVHGGFTDDDLPFAMEFDNLAALGTGSIDLQIKYTFVTNAFTLKWSAPISTLLQSCTNLSQHSWLSETNVSTSGFSSSFLVSLTNASKFYRLLPVTNSGNQIIASSGGLGGNTGGNAGGLFPKGGKPIAHPNGGLSPNPTNPPPGITYYTNFIDIASYTGNSTNSRAAYFPGWRTDSQSEYTLNYDSHNGGADSFYWRIYTNLTYDPNQQNGYRWTRIDNSQNLFSWTTSWDPSSTNWPDGLRTESGSNEQRWATAPYTTVADIPWAKINMTAISDPVQTGNLCYGWSCAYTGIVSRVDDTHLHLHTGLNALNNNYKYVLITSAASRVDSLSLGFTDTFTPDSGSVAPYATYTGLSWSNITVLGKPLNADSCVLIKTTPAATNDATPTITGASNYTFAVEIIQQSVESLTRLYHPLFDVPPFTVPVPKLLDLQNHFNNGTDFLAEDNDTKINDSDPVAAVSTNTSSVYLSDDVPTYVEFEVTDGPTVTNVLTRRTGPVFPSAYKSAEFYRVRSNPSADALLAISDATIKIVKTLQYSGGAADGLAPIGTSSILLIHTLPGIAGPHEWGHTRGLEHRGTSSNPGPITNALMNPSNYTNDYKVNRYERSLLAPP